MESLRRLLLVCLLLVAVPLQGIAAASAVACGPNHRDMYGQPGSSSDAHAGDVHGDTLAHRDVLVHSDAVVHSDATAQADSSSLPISQHAKYKCHACAPCCTGGALTSEFRLHLDPPASLAAIARLGVGLACVPLDGLERPPRSFLA